MSTKRVILEELNERAVDGIVPYDVVLGEYMQRLYQKTKRNTIFYATAWTDLNKVKTDSQNMGITIDDIWGLMQTIHGLKGENLDLILYSPGGSPEAAEAIVSYLREEFSNIRVVIPDAALSAATMLACASDKIVMGKHSLLGPTDPHVLAPSPNGSRYIPAQSVLEEFELAKKQIQDDEIFLKLWMLIMRQYSPTLLVQCKQALKLSRILVEQWLNDYMFLGMDDRDEKARNIAEILSDKDSYAPRRYLSRDYAKGLGLVVDGLEDDRELQDLVLSAFHVMMHRFGGTKAVKIIINHLGVAFVINQTPY